NWQSEIGNKNVPLNNAGLQKCLKCFGLVSFDPELFSWLFYVAASRLNSPRLSSVLIRCAQNDCQVARIHTVFVRHKAAELLLCRVRSDPSSQIGLDAAAECLLFVVRHAAS